MLCKVCSTPFHAPLQAKTGCTQHFYLLLLCKNTRFRQPWFRWRREWVTRCKGDGSRLAATGGVVQCLCWGEDITGRWEGKCTTPKQTHNLQSGTGSGSGSGVATGVLTGLGLSESLIHDRWKKRQHRSVTVLITAGSLRPAGTHLCGIIFSVVSPSIMVTLLLLMYAPLWLEGELAEPCLLLARANVASR